MLTVLRICTCWMPSTKQDIGITHSTLSLRDHCGRVEREEKARLRLEVKKKVCKMLPSGRTEPRQTWFYRSWSETRQDRTCQISILDLGGAHRALELPVEPLATDEFCGKDSNQLQTCAHLDKLFQAYSPKRAPVKRKVLQSQAQKVNIENNFYHRQDHSRGRL